MDHTGQEALTVRMAKLERQNQRLWVGVLVAGALGLLSMSARAKAAGGETIESQQFILKDAAGQRWGEWLIEGGHGVLRLYGSNGRPIAELPLQPTFHPAGR